ncbi:sodium-dependent lysophosphatidylcholine symporter 1-like isoform X7 [Anser cygnoides]|uniref:sodium-dependent lysophosphatidylcholine symporter 1-like isoform X7 n=1 Tax=Anser cygnoides TaxID=8845 RepID=UPI0034D1CC1F
MRVVQPWIRSQSWAPALAGAPGGKELCWGATWGKNLPGPAALSPLSLPVLGFACWCLLLLWLEQLLGWIGAWASASSSIPRDLGVAAALGQGEGARPCLTVEEHQISPYGCGNPGSYCPAAAWAGSGHAPPSVPLASPPSAPPGGLSDVASSLAKPPSRSDQCLRCAPRRLLPLPARGSLCAAAAATRGRRTGSCFPALAEMLRCPGRTGREQSLRGERPTARIACSMPFGVLCYCMMWSTLADGAPVSLKFLWYLFTYNFFQICMTCYHVPYSSLTMFLGGTQRDRDSATAYRMGMEVFSTLLGSGIQGQMVGAYHGRMTNGCSFGNGTLPNSSTPGLAGSLEGTRRAYVSASLVLGSIYCLSCLILVFGVREQPGPLSPLGKAGLPFMSCLRTIVGHKPYTQLLCGFLFASLAFQVMQGIFAFFCTHAAGLAGKFQHLVLIMLVTASLSIPFWQWFLGRFGKKTAVTLGLALIIPALVAITQVSHNFPAFVLLMVVAGCSSAVLYLLPCFAGYRTGDCTYNPTVALALKLLMAPVPIILLLIAITIFCLHPINEERRKQMRMELEAMGRQARRGSSDHHQG